MNKVSLKQCRLCGHGCGADRLNGGIGRCGAGSRMMVAGGLLHYGEEPPISGERGSGAVFFTHCPLDCRFCQNYQISQDHLGRKIEISELADMMLGLQEQGAHNINLVSPTPWVEHIIDALEAARKNGLSLPVVYNTGGFDSLKALGRLDGLVDIYLPDAKYADGPTADHLSGAPNYVSLNRIALKEMFRQVGHLSFDESGGANRGLLVRHLVLPDGLAQTGEVLTWLADTFGPDVWVSLMAQYRPCYQTLKAPPDYPSLGRPLTEGEYEDALDTAWDLGMENVFIQELAAADVYVPDFEQDTIFEKIR